MTASETQPNVLLILTDQQRWDTIGAFGSPMELTPNLDTLAHAGTRLTQAISPQPNCGPARAVIHTGRYATETGVWRNSIPLGDEPTLAHYFNEAGYETGFVGSWHLAGTFDEPIPADQRGGFSDFWIAADVPEFTTQPHEGTLFNEDGDPVSFEQYRVNAFTEYTKQAIKTLEEPFFLVVNYLEPHDQNDRWTFVAPDGYADRYKPNPDIPDDLLNRPGQWYDELPDYYGICERLDECVGDLLGTLENEVDRENTIVGYTSDHGCHFQTRPGEHKRSCHESSVHVPAILAGPGFDHGRVLDQVTSLVDLAPTLLDAAGIAVPSEMHGESLLPVVHGEETETRNEAFIQISESEIGRAIRTDRWKYSVAAPTLDGWRGGNGDPDSDLYVERYLYDLQRDPAESINLVGRYDYRETADSLRNALLSYIQDIEGSNPEIRAYENPGYRDS